MGYFILPDELDLLKEEITLVRSAIKLLLTTGQATVTTVAGNTRSYTMADLDKLKTYVKELVEEYQEDTGDNSIWLGVAY